MAALMASFNERDFNLLMTFLTDAGEVLARSQRALWRASLPEQADADQTLHRPLA